MQSRKSQRKHPALELAARFCMSVGAGDIAIAMVQCVTTAAVLGPGAFVPRELLVLVLFVALALLTPGIALMCCASPISRGGRNGVIVAIVFSSLNLVSILFMLVVNGLVCFALISSDERARGSGSLLTSSLMLAMLLAMLTGLVFNLIRLSGCFAVIRMHRESGGYGFDPVMPGAAESSPPAPAADPAQWPDIGE